MFIFFKLSIYLLITFFMFGCTTSEKSSEKFPNIIMKPIKTVSAIEDRNVMVLNAKKKKELIEQPEIGYKIKAGDKIVITVTDHPEISTSKSPGLTDKTAVNKDGTIQLPYIGIIYVEGKTTKELRDVILEKLETFLINPDVIVSVVFVRKFRYNLVGEFIKVDIVEKEYKMTLLELISSGKGVKKDVADLRHSYVIRNKKKLPVNIYRLLEKGDISQNIDMRDRDTVVIPSYKIEQFVYLYSETTQATKSKVPLIDGRLTLIQALSIGTLVSINKKRIDFKSVYVVRTEMDRIETFKIDAEKMFKGQALPFELVAGDVIYIPKTQIGTITQVVTDIFPILELLQKTLSNFETYGNVKNQGFFW